MKSKIKNALIISSIFFILGCYPLLRNAYSSFLNRDIEQNYIATQGRILKRINVSFNESYHKMRLYVEYHDNNGNTYTSWVQMPVSSDRYPQEFTTVYYNPRQPGKIRYPESGTSIIIGYVLSVILFGAGIAVLYHYVKKPPKQLN